MNETLKSLLALSFVSKKNQKLFSQIEEHYKQKETSLQALKGYEIVEKYAEENNLESLDFFDKSFMGYALDLRRGKIEV